MPSEPDSFLSEGFEDYFPSETLGEDPSVLLGERRRRRQSATPPPGVPERRGRRKPNRKLLGLTLVALLLHALPVAAYVLLNHLELLGASTEGGTGWNHSYLVVLKGEPDLPPGPVEIPNEAPPLPSSCEPEEAWAEITPPAMPDPVALAMPTSISAFPTPEGGSGEVREVPERPLSAVPPSPARAGGGAGGPVRGEGESLGSAGEREAPVWNPLPAYPDSARKAGREGSVEIELEVGADGRVVEARILSSSGFEALDRAALDALRRWRFASGAFARTLRQEVVFRLENSGCTSLVQK